MKTYTITDIRDLQPCYDPTRYLPADWQGIAIDVLNVAACPAADRLWVVTQWLDDRTNRLFAVWCARQALKLISDPDPRSVAACDVAERHANGAATDSELCAARAAAWDAAVVAAGDAAVVAAWNAAVVAAWDAAVDAAVVAAGDAAVVAAWNAAGDAAVGAAGDAQIAHLIGMLQEATDDSTD